MSVGTAAGPGVPDAGPRDHEGSPRRRLIHIGELGLVLVVCAAALWRYPAHGSYAHTLWAEDARVFMACTLQHSLPSCTSQPYQGYLQLAPRVLVTLVPHLPVTRWPLAVSLLALLGNAVSLTIVYRSSAWLIPSRVLRALTVLTFALSAAAHWEAAGNLANLHWWLLLSSLFLAADRDSSDAVGWTAARTAWLVMTCLSEGETPAIVLAFVVGLLLRRSRRGGWSRTDLGAGLLVAVAAAGQLTCSALHPRYGIVGAPYSAGDVLRAYWHDLLRQSWDGPSPASIRLAHAALVVIVALLVLGLAVAARQRRLTRACLVPLGSAVVLVLGSVASLALSLVVNRSFSARYLMVPFALLLVAVVTALAYLFGGRARGFVLPAVALLAAAVTVFAIGPISPLVAEVPSWHTRVTQARQVCRGADPPSAVFLGVAPHPSWRVLVSCRRLLD